MKQIVQLGTLRLREKNYASERKTLGRKKFQKDWTNLTSVGYFVFFATISTSLTLSVTGSGLVKTTFSTDLDCGLKMKKNWKNYK